MDSTNEDQLKQEYASLQEQLEDPAIYQKPTYPKLAKRHKELENIINLFNKKTTLKESLKQAEKLINDSDSNLANLAKTEVEQLTDELDEINAKLQIYLNPDSADNNKDCILEIRAGVGGSEAGLFVADLNRMYTKFAEKQDWRLELISCSQSDIGGFKEIIVEVTGNNVYKLLKYESGVHRVQRIPSTESQGRIHTSTASVAVMPKVEEVELEIPNVDLRIDTYRSSGHGGQSVNTTDSAVRITHIPTNMIVTCQDEKSQIKNKEKAMSVLRTRLLQKQKEEQDSQTSQQRKKLIGKAFRNEKIRTYNFPQDRLTDHRINLNFNNLADILNGNLSNLIEALQTYEAQSIN